METRHVFDGGKDRALAAADLLGEVFQTDPVFQFLLHTLSAEKRNGAIDEFIHILMRSTAKNNGVFDEAWVTPAAEDKGNNNNTASLPTPGEESKARDVPQCSCVWMPPECTIDNLRTYLSMDALKMLCLLKVPSMKRVLIDFSAATDAAKKRGLINPADGSRIKRYYYLFFVGCDAKFRGRGLASGLIRHLQERATAEGVPIWLESTTPDSHRLYLRLGFVDTEPLVLGKGVVDEKGLAAKGGSGVTIWGMIWWPEKNGETGAGT